MAEAICHFLPEEEHVAIFFLIVVRSVSYTHLDVYKRQTYAPPPKKFSLPE